MSDTTSVDGAARETIPYVAKKAGFLPLFRVYRRAEAAKLYRWPQVEEGFFSGLWEFDQEFIAGRTSKRSNQAARAGFLKDIVTLLLENGSNKKLQSKRVVPGLFFSNYMLESTYPKTGAVEILIQTRAAGVPNFSGRQRQRLKGGLDEWIKEASLKTIDLKAEWARHTGQGGGPTSDLLTWLRQSKPLSYMFLAIRVVDAKDFDRAVFFANAANQMMDGVGLVAYEVNVQGDGYQACKIPPHLELDRVLSRVCTALRNLP